MGLPRFYFSIEIMAAKAGIQDRVSPIGRWMPPNSPENNIKTRLHAKPVQAPAIFYFDGTTTHLQQPQPFPAHFRVFKVYSLYYDQGVFWAVDCDATFVKPPDSPVEEEDSDEEEDDELDWRSLSFENKNIGNQRVSYAGLRLPERTLRYQRDDQRWAELLLSDVYQAAPDRHTSDATRGGLIGDLPLLIGIAAMSIPPQYTGALLPQMIVGPSWHACMQIPRRAGWFDRRGLIIRVLYNPNETSEQQLAAFERGQYGKILD